MNYLTNFSRHFVITAALLLAAIFSASAQNPVESTHIDEKYAYTTVVYKNTAVSDKDVLTSLENDFGIGDVVRVTLAPPPAPLSAVAASEPVYADKSKGEDAWMPGSAKSATNLTASAKPSVPSKTSVNTIVASPKPVATAPKPIIVAKTSVSEVPKQVKSVDVVSVPAQNVVVTPLSNGSTTLAKAKTSTTGKSAKANKSSKKSGKKSGQKLKNRKHGKQRYGCPKF